MLKEQEIDNNLNHMKKRMQIAQKKIDILNKKLEDCKKTNAPLPPAVCDTKPLKEAESELKQCRISIVHLEHAKQIRALKKGDIIFCYTTGNRRQDRETGFRPFEYNLELSKARDGQRGWFQHDIWMQELKIVEKRKDNRYLAVVNGDGKKQFLGVPMTENQSYYDSDLGKELQWNAEDLIFYRFN